MFTQFDFAKDGRAVLSLAAAPERFRELLEKNGVVPAPSCTHPLGCVGRLERLPHRGVERSAEERPCTSLREASEAYARSACKVWPNLGRERQLVLQRLAEARKNQRHEREATTTVFAGGAFGKLKETRRRLLALVLFRRVRHCL